MKIFLIVTLIAAIIYMLYNIYDSIDVYFNVIQKEYDESSLSEEEKKFFNNYPLLHDRAKLMIVIVIVLSLITMYYEHIIKLFS